MEDININEDVNAFYKQHEWRRLTSSSRATKGRSGEPLDIWSAVYGPLGDDGHFKPLFDKETGVIDRDAAEYCQVTMDDTSLVGFLQPLGDLRRVDDTDSLFDRNAPARDAVGDRLARYEVPAT